MKELNKIKNICLKTVIFLILQFKRNVIEYTRINPLYS